MDRYLLTLEPNGDDAQESLEWVSLCIKLCNGEMLEKRIDKHVPTILLSLRDDVMSLLSNTTSMSSGRLYIDNQYIIDPHKIAVIKHVKVLTEDAVSVLEKIVDVAGHTLEYLNTSLRSGVLSETHFIVPFYYSYATSLNIIWEVLSLFRMHGHRPEVDLGFFGYLLKLKNALSHDSFTFNLACNILDTFSYLFENSDYAQIVIDNCFDTKCKANPSEQSAEMDYVSSVVVRAMEFDVHSADTSGKNEKYSRILQSNPELYLKEVELDSVRRYLDETGDINKCMDILGPMARLVSTNTVRLIHVLKDCGYAQEAMEILTEVSSRSDMAEFGNLDLPATFLALSGLKVPDEWVERLSVSMDATLVDKFAASIIEATQTMERPPETLYLLLWYLYKSERIRPGPVYLELDFGKYLRDTPDGQVAKGLFALLSNSVKCVIEAGNASTLLEGAPLNSFKVYLDMQDTPQTQTEVVEVFLSQENKDSVRHTFLTVFPHLALDYLELTWAEPERRVFAVNVSVPTREQVSMLVSERMQDIVRSLPEGFSSFQRVMLFYALVAEENLPFSTDIPFGQISSLVKASDDVDEHSAIGLVRRFFFSPRLVGLFSPEIARGMVQIVFVVAEAASHGGDWLVTSFLDLLSSPGHFGNRELSMIYFEGFGYFVGYYVRAQSYEARRAVGQFVLEQFLRFGLDREQCKILLKNRIFFKLYSNYIKRSPTFFTVAGCLVDREGQSHQRVFKISLYSAENVSSTVLSCRSPSDHSIFSIGIDGQRRLVINGIPVFEDPSERYTMSISITRSGVDVLLTSRGLRSYPLVSEIGRVELFCGCSGPIYDFEILRDGRSFTAEFLDSNRENLARSVPPGPVFASYFEENEFAVPELLEDTSDRITPKRLDMSVRIIAQSAKTEKALVRSLFYVVNKYKENLNRGTVEHLLEVLKPTKMGKTNIEKLDYRSTLLSYWRKREVPASRHALLFFGVLRLDVLDDLLSSPGGTEWMLAMLGRTQPLRKLAMTATDVAEYVERDVDLSFKHQDFVLALLRMDKPHLLDFLRTRIFKGSDPRLVELYSKVLLVEMLRKSGSALKTVVGWFNAGGFERALNLIVSHSDTSHFISPQLYLVVVLAASYLGFTFEGALSRMFQDASQAVARGARYVDYMLRYLDRPPLGDSGEIYSLEEFFLAGRYSKEILNDVGKFVLFENFDRPSVQAFIRKVEPHVSLDISRFLNRLALYKDSDEFASYLVLKSVSDISTSINADQDLIKGCYYLYIDDRVGRMGNYKLLEGCANGLRMKFEWLKAENFLLNTFDLAVESGSITEILLSLLKWTQKLVSVCIADRRFHESLFYSRFLLVIDKVPWDGPQRRHIRCILYSALLFMHEKSAISWLFMAIFDILGIKKDSDLVHIVSRYDDPEFTVELKRASRPNMDLLNILCELYINYNLYTFDPEDLVAKKNRLLDAMITNLIYRVVSKKKRFERFKKLLVSKNPGIEQFLDVGNMNVRKKTEYIKRIYINEYSTKMRDDCSVELEDCKEIKHLVHPSVEER